MISRIMERMARQGSANIPLKESQISGLKYFQPLSRWLSALHDAGCERDRAGNRQFFMDQYLSLVLLFMFNPICSSMRSLQRAGELPKVRPGVWASTACRWSAFRRRAGCSTPRCLSR
jgi:hypothetical protein